MILKIKSQNDYLLDVLNKNPNTDLGLYLTKNRNGVIVGNVINKNRYDCVFYDTKHSYDNYEKSQIGYQSHCNPFLTTSIINNLFSDLLKERDLVRSKNIPWLNKTISEVDNMPCEVIVEDIYIDSGWIDDDSKTFLLSKYLNNVTIENKYLNIYRLNINSDNIVDALNTTLFISFMINISNGENNERPFIDDDLIIKMVRIMKNIKEIPYFVYYLFIKRVVVLKEKIWDKVKSELESNILNSSGMTVKFTKNGTHTDRIIFVSDNLDYSNNILDFGCGEFSHFKKINKKVEKEYYAYDIEDYSDYAEKLNNERFSSPKSKKINYLKDLNYLPQDLDEAYSVILSEVIEHNDIETSKIIIEDLVNNRIKNIKQLIITTPNKNFNKHYKMSDEDKRHDGHLFEFTEEEFKSFIDSLSLNKLNEIKFYGISDCVNYDYVTSGVVITFN